MNFKTPARTEINFNAGYRLSPSRSRSLLRTSVGNGYESGESWAGETNTASSGGKFSSKLPLYERYPLSWTQFRLPSFLLYPFVFHRCTQSCVLLASSANRTANRTRRCIQGEAARRPDSFLLVTRADLGRSRLLRKAERLARKVTSTHAEFALYALTRPRFHRAKRCHRRQTGTRRSIP